MNTYYIHSGNESIGPFGLDELRSKKITKTTPVWCQGMEDWKHAGEVAELKSILFVAPPPLKSIITASQVSVEIEDNIENNRGKIIEGDVEKEQPNPKILGIKRDIFFPAAIALVLIIGTVSFNLFETNRNNELEQKNSITEKDNQQFQLQEKQILEQKLHILEQDRIEAERIASEKNHKINSRLLEIQKILLDDIRNLDEAKNKLKEANDFEFLRTTDEKSEEISLIQNDIEHWIDEIGKLKEEKEQLYLELEKTIPKVRGVSN